MRKERLIKKATKALHRLTRQKISGGLTREIKIIEKKINSYPIDKVELILTNKGLFEKEYFPNKMVAQTDGKNHQIRQIKEDEYAFGEKRLARFKKMVEKFHLRPSHLQTIRLSLQ